MSSDDKPVEESQTKKKPAPPPKQPAYLDNNNDCARPQCDDVKTMFQKALAASNNSSSTKATKETTGIECPPDRAALGRGSWALLHSMAAWYPDKPRPQDQTMMKNFFDALARFYPCPHCAEDFAKNLKQKPVPTESRTELCQWLCEQHNVVNKKLGKKTFSCDMKTLDERWRTSSDPSC